MRSLERNLRVKTFGVIVATIMPTERKKQISEFYRQEFIRHRSRLEHQRSFFIEQAYEEIELILDKIIDEMDKISQIDDFERLASQLLYRIDVVTSLSTSQIDPSYRIN